MDHFMYKFRCLKIKIFTRSQDLNIFVDELQSSYLFKYLPIAENVLKYHSHDIGQNIRSLCVLSIEKGYTFLLQNTPP